MDVDALQSQIDLSNSTAYDLVSSWVKPLTYSSTTSVSHTISRELEEYAKRPPRLGLGATVSQSNLATSREAARLKEKLVGQKRRRDDSNDHRSPIGPQPYNGEDEVDESESRSRAISTKKARVNGSLGKEPEGMKGHVTQKRKTTGDSLDLPSIPSHISVKAPNNTLPTTFSATCPTRQAHPPLPPQSAPLLNLHGPPLVQVGDGILVHPQEGSVNPKKRKRRRRRGKGGKSRGGEEVV